MSDLIDPQRSGPATGRIWGFWGTLLWGIACYAALTVAQIAVALVALSVLVGDGAAGAPDLDAFAANGVIVSLSAIAAAPAVLAVIAFAIRRAGAGFAAYLALNSFSRRDLFTGLGAIAIYIPFIALLAALTERPMTPTVVVDTFRTAREAGALLTLTLAVSAVAPITEEFAVRGFLFRGWAASRLGASGAVVLTAALWALIHIQYEWFFVGEIFGAGLIFGVMRARSGSTWLTVVLHGAYNLAALVQAAMLDSMS